MTGRPLTTEFHGLPVTAFEPGHHGDVVPESNAWFLSAARRKLREFPTDQTRNPPEFPEIFERFLDEVDTGGITALVFGHTAWEAPLACELLADTADRFPRLRALRVGDEHEQSMTARSDSLTPVLDRFPLLEHLEVRGWFDAEPEPMRHEALKTLRLDSWDLPSKVVRMAAASDLPALEHLDLWLGLDDGMAWIADMEDVEPVLSGDLLPSLRTLGLRGSEIQDEVAEGIATAPVVARLRRLSLAEGALTDDGVEALLAGQPLTHLEQLDVHDHYISDDMAERLKAALPTTEVDISGANGEWPGSYQEVLMRAAEDSYL